MTTPPKFLRALAGERVWPPPLWIMRQAGRYLPEYRQLRAQHDFLTVCRTPELACELTLQPLRRFPFDASIVFSDIMVPLASLGVALTFDPGPRLAAPLRSRAAIESLRMGAEGEVAPAVCESIRLLRRELKVPLIGFAGAPLTLAAYLVEGHGGKDFPHLRALMAGDPELASLLLGRLGDMTARYLSEQVRAGAQVVQLFDSWAGLVSLPTYTALVLPVMQRLCRQLAGLGVPRILYAQNAACLWPALATLEVEGFGIDWRLGLAEVRGLVPANSALQGNLDPAILLAGPQATKAAAQEVLAASAGGAYVFNLGHGILPGTPIDSVEALLATVHGA